MRIIEALLLCPGGPARQIGASREAAEAVARTGDVPAPGFRARLSARRGTARGGMMGGQDRLRPFRPEPSPALLRDAKRRPGSTRRQPFNRRRTPFGSDRRGFADCETPQLRLSQFRQRVAAFLSGRWRHRYDRLRRRLSWSGENRLETPVKAGFKRRAGVVGQAASLPVRVQARAFQGKRAARPTVLKSPRGAEECGDPRRAPWC